MPADASPAANATPETSATAPLLVACLCARWCGTCRDYDAVFDAARRRFGGAARFVQVDIEDDEALLDGLEVENFPTLLIAGGDAPLFFGTITPHPQTLVRLVDGALAGDLKAVRDDAAVVALAQRVRAFAGS